MSNYILIAALHLFVVSACSRSNDEPKSQLVTVFGSDNRRPMDTNRMPYQAIGMLLVADQRICTGSLVGTDLVLTSAHCLGANFTGEQDKITFHLGFRQREQTAASRVINIYRGTAFPLKNRAQDWAVLQLEVPLGARFGYLEPVIPTAAASFPVTVAGYSLDFLKRYGEPGVHHNCRVHYRYNQLLRHDCDSDSGASGGPILAFFKNKTVKLVGIHVTSASCAFKHRGAPERCPKGTPYQHDYANFGVSAESFYDKIRFLRRQGRNHTSK